MATMASTPMTIPEIAPPLNDAEGEERKGEGGKEKRENKKSGEIGWDVEGKKMRCG
jgi:hypothetical protein